MIQSKGKVAIKLNPAKPARFALKLRIPIRYTRRAFWPLWPLLLKRAGLADVRSRRDMKQVVGLVYLEKLIGN